MTNEIITYRLGPGVKFVVFLIGLILVLALGYGAGITHTKFKQEESNVKVLSNDSVEAQEIEERTKELKNEINNWLKYNDPVDKHGAFTDEWLQLMESQKSIARERGYQGSIVRKVTKL